MEGQPNSDQFYLSQNWTPVARRNTYAATSPLSPSNIAPAQHFPSPLEQLSSLLPQQSAQFNAQLEHYNKLIESGGRASRGQSSPQPPYFSSGSYHTPSRKSSWNDNSSTRSGPKGHGSKKSPSIGKGERSLMTTEDNIARMAKKSHHDFKGSFPSTRNAMNDFSYQSQQSNSVPSTPHQRPRKFSYASREPSPSALPNHSPRSAYSETDSTLPSLRPLPPRLAACKYETAMQHSRRRMAYSIGTERLERVKPDQIKARLTESEERKLATDMRELYDRILPTPRGEANRKKFVEKLEDIMNKEWPCHGIKVHMFGSSGNMLCTDESDVDICITTDPDWKELDSVCKLAELLARSGMEKVICVNSAKVPIVKIWDPELKLAVDMNVNNSLALENTRMIKTYIQLDERVRPLAMIIKHWTKRRVMNDAAFGGTLSSYTWICMIINFLQSRKPPILPALQQRPHNKLRKNASDASVSAFGDDVEALKSFGSANKETYAELLFHFFRYYAHELDYDHKVVSVRHGKLLTKSEKNWQYSTNNMLCVEEPFNVGRNLANTADDTSFRGLHMELRRAFELIADGKLEECCEEYIFPKEEERIWERPAPQPKPTLTPAHNTSRDRSNGRRRGRGNLTSNGNERRRPTPSYELHGGQGVQQQVVSMPSSPYVTAEWLHAQSQMHADLNSQLTQLKAQENNLRNMLYQQSQQYAHMQGGSSHQFTRNGGIITDRNRGNSFDNPPMTAPIRSDQYFYPMLTQPFTQQGTSTYPSSPLLSPGLPELRRGSRVASIASNHMASTESGSTLRSQSQPASRNLQIPGTAQAGQAPYYSTYHQNAYQQNGALNTKAVDDDIAQMGSASSASIPMSSSDAQIPKEYVGYFVNNAPPTRGPMVLSAIPSYHELRQNRPRRPSTDQFPHAIFERVRRTSRSPSPSRQYPLSFHSNLPPANAEDNAMANGSLTSYRSRQPSSLSGSSMSDEQSYDSVAASMDTLSIESAVNDEQLLRGHEKTFINQTQNGQKTQYTGPPIVNGSSALTAGLGLGINGIPVGTVQPTNLNSSDHTNGAHRTLQGGRQRMKNGTMSPLDIASNKQELAQSDLPHLSPVYETHTPSPTTNRKLELSLADEELHRVPSRPATKAADNNFTLKLALTNSHKPGPDGSAVANSSARVHGHIRNAKSEGSILVNGWQKPKQKGTKRGLGNEAMAQDATQTFSEKLPSKESDRKGG